MSALVPICDAQAEEIVLSAALVDTGLIETIRDHVSVEDFFLDANGSIFDAMTQLADTTGAFDVVSLAGYLRDRGQLDRIGGSPKLAEVLNAPAVPLAHVTQHAKRVRDLAHQRRLTAAARVIAAQGANPLDGTLEDFARDAEDRIAKAIESSSTRDLPEAIGTVSVRVVDEAMSRGERAIGDPCGLAALDRELSGWEPGLYVIAGRPSMGKTSLAMRITRGLADQTGKLSVFVSCEMPKEQLAQRLLCAEARVPLATLRSGGLTPTQHTMLIDGAASLGRVPMVITQRPGATVTEVRGVVRRALREQRRNFGQALKLGCIVCDYMQVMRGDQRGTRESEVASISRGLMELAGEFGVPLLGLSQLNRSVEARSDKRPLMSDLRESGAIEQDAYVILFPYRDEVYHPETADPGTAEVIIGKSRNGQPGAKVKLAFEGRFALFDNHPRDCSSIDEIAGGYTW